MIHRLRPLAPAVVLPGVLLVFLGLSGAMDFTPAGTIASAAAILALLYAGAAWARSTPPAADRPEPTPILVFDASLRIVTGAGAGQPLAEAFPAHVRDEIARGCAAALSGTAARIICAHGERPIAYDAVPVRRADGSVAFGMLLPAESASAVVTMAR